MTLEREARRSGIFVGYKRIVHNHIQYSCYPTNVLCTLQQSSSLKFNSLTTPSFPTIASDRPTQKYPLLPTVESEGTDGKCPGSDVVDTDQISGPKEVRKLD